MEYDWWKTLRADESTTVNDKINADEDDEFGRSEWVLVNEIQTSEWKKKKMERREERYKIRYFDNDEGWKREGSFSIDSFITCVDPFLFSLFNT